MKIKPIKRHGSFPDIYKTLKQHKKKEELFRGKRVFILSCHTFHTSHLLK